MKNKTYIISGILIVVALAGGFFGGMQYQKSQRNTTFAQFGRLQGGQGQFARRFGNGARPIIGDIISSDDKSITVKMQDGSTKIVVVSSTTAINKAAEGTKADLKTGARVAAFGTENADGSLTAQNIQLNPAMRFGPGGGQRPSPTQ